MKRRRTKGEDETQVSSRPRLDIVEDSPWEFDVSEVFLHPCVVEVAKEKGLRGGLSCEKTWQDRFTERELGTCRTGEHSASCWDCGERELRSRLLIVSPPKTTLSSLQSFRPSGLPQNDLKDETNLLHVAFKVCQVQKKVGGFFDLENSLTSRGWRDEKVLELWNEGGVFDVIFDQCEYGLTSTALEKIAYVRVDKYASDCDHVDHRMPRRSLSHASDTWKSTTSSNIFRKLCRAMVQALQLELKVLEEVNVAMATDELHDQKKSLFEDEATGERLDPEKVKVGRKKELDRFEDLGVFEAVP